MNANTDSINELFSDNHPAIPRLKTKQIKNKKNLMTQKTINTIVLSLFSAASILITFININQPILELHGFRQTQTALTAYWLDINGFQLAYETPVSGYPWAIPFEFPIYQLIVSLISNELGAPLDATGRIVSIVFFNFCLIILLGIYKKLTMTFNDFIFTAILLLTTPIYLFWSRTFMIETTALFFTLVSLYFFIDLTKPVIKNSSLFGFMVSLTLALLQKITTAGPVLMVMCFIILYRQIRFLGLFKINLSHFLKIGISILIPTLVAVSWIYFTNETKMNNGFGTSLTSDALSKWNFGTLDQRLDYKNWKIIIWDRTIIENLSGLLGLSFIAVGHFLLNRKLKIIFSVLMILYFLPILIFFNLYLVHDYYQVANIIFLVAACGLVLSQLHERYKPDRLNMGILLGATFVGLNIFSYINGYYKYVKSNITPETNSILTVAEVVRENTDRNSALVIYGADWSSELAYYAQRKSLTLPQWSRNYSAAWNDPEQELGGLPIGAVLFCNFSANFSLKQISDHSLIKKYPYIYSFKDCHLWFPAAQEITLNSQRVPPTNLAEIIHLEQ